MYPDAQGSLIEYNVITDNSKACKANLTFSGEAPGGEYQYAHASSNNKVFYNLITFAACRYNVDSYYPRGSATPVGNEAAFNCVFSAPYGNFGDLQTDDGAVAYTQHDNVNADPRFVNRAAGDYRLEAGSPCAGRGPR
jgi:hypothetical protein